MSDGRSQLLDAAAELFAARGYDAVSMRDIAKVVGVTQANLYYHFRDKADLIQATLAQVFEARAEHLEASLRDHPDNRIEAFVRWFVAALTTDRIFARLLYRELLDGDADRIDALSRKVLQRPFRAVAAAIAPTAGTVSPDAAALSLVGFILGQVLVLPLAPGLVAADRGAESADALAAHVLSLVEPGLEPA
jgi:AcrR family transcriptional regulator